MKPGSFKTMMESMAEHMASTLKHGGPAASMAIKKAEAPYWKEPEEPSGDKVTRREELRFDAKWKAWYAKTQTWEDNCGKIFEKLSSHCAPTMKTKLRGMEGWSDIEEKQDGIKLVKLLHRVYFDTDGSRQSMREMVLADKKLYLCFQKKDWTLDEYTREFQARLEVCEEIGSSPGQDAESARIAARADGEDYDALAGTPDNIERMKGYLAAGQKQYLAALHFEGLNNVHFSELKQEVHNGWIVHGADTTPKTIEQTLVMCDKYRHRVRRTNVPVKSEDAGIACI